MAGGRWQVAKEVGQLARVHPLPLPWGEWSEGNRPRTSGASPQGSGRGWTLARNMTHYPSLPPIAARRDRDYPIAPAGGRRRAAWLDRYPAAAAGGTNDGGDGTAAVRA